MRHALFKGFERGKDGASIRAVGTGGGRKTGKADRIAHARRLQRQLCRLLDHDIGAFQGRAIRQLHVHNQIALVLGKEEKRFRSFGAHIKGELYAGLRG